MALCRQMSPVGRWQRGGDDKLVCCNNVKPVSDKDRVITGGEGSAMPRAP